MGWEDAGVSYLCLAPHPLQGQRERVGRGHTPQSWWDPVCAP